MAMIFLAALLWERGSNDADEGTHIASRTAAHKSIKTTIDCLSTWGREVHSSGAVVAEECQLVVDVSGSYANHVWCRLRKKVGTAKTREVTIRGHRQ